MVSTALSWYAANARREIELCNAIIDQAQRDLDDALARRDRADEALAAIEARMPVTS